MEEEEEAKEKEEEEAFSYLCTQKGAEEEEIPDPSFLLIWTPRERVIDSFLPLPFYLRRSRQVLELFELVLFLLGGSSLIVNYCMVFRLNNFTSGWDPPTQPISFSFDFGSMTSLRGGIRHS